MGTLTNKIKIADVMDKGSGAVILYNGKLSVSLLLVTSFYCATVLLLLFNISVGMSTKEENYLKFRYEGYGLIKERNIAL